MDEANPVVAKGSRCTARSKRTGEPCKRSPAPGWGVCKMHGAGGGRPIVHGRYSKVLGRFRKSYEEALANESLLDLGPTLALLDVRAEQLLEHVDEGREGAWQELVQVISQRARRTEKACELRLKGQQAINARDLVEVLTKFANLIIEEIGPAAAKPVIDRLDREILGELDSRGR